MSLALATQLVPQPAPEQKPQPELFLQSRVRHLAIIPDGNRRWARRRGMTTEEGHYRGLRELALGIASSFELWTRRTGATSVIAGPTTLWLVAQRRAPTCSSTTTQPGS